MKLDECVWLSTLIEDGNVLIVPYKTPLQDRQGPARRRQGESREGQRRDQQHRRIGARHGRPDRAGSERKVQHHRPLVSPTQLIGGHIAMAFGNTAETSSREGQTRQGLAKMGDRRVPYCRSIPPMKEAGDPCPPYAGPRLLRRPGLPDRSVQFLAGRVREGDEDRSSMKNS